MKQRIFTTALICGFVFAGIEARAQDEPPQSPLTSAPQTEIMLEPVENSETMFNEIPVAVTPDAYPVTSGVLAGVGSWGPRKSFAIPELRVVETLDSNPMMTEKGNYRGFTSVAAGLKAVQYLGRTAELRYAGAFRYNSVATLYAERRITNAHDLGLAKTFNFKRSKLYFEEDAQYSEGSASGGDGMEGLGSISTHLSEWGGFSGVQLSSGALAGGLSPDQSILTWRTSRLSSTTLGEFDHYLSARSLLTGAGYFGVLHFYDSPLVNSFQEGGFAGYARVLSDRDSLGLQYGFARFSFSNEDFDLRTHYGGLLYRRRLTGHLSFQAGAGPQYLTQGGVSDGYYDLDWQGTGNLVLHSRRGEFRATCMRMVTGGSGVLFGTRTSSGTLSASFRLTRKMDFSMEGGAARNDGVLANESYDSQFGGVGISRRMSSTIAAFLNYNIQNQTQTGAQCVGGNCAVVGMRQLVGAGISWTKRPFGIY